MRFREIWEYIMSTPGNTNKTILKQMIDEYAAGADLVLSVDADIEDSVDLLGKKASDLQKDIFIDDGKVFGTIKYVKGYTGFSGRADEQQGYYLVLHYESEGADSIKVNGVTLDNDGLHILILKKFGGKVKVEMIKDENVVVDWLDLSGLKYE